MAKLKLNIALDFDGTYTADPAAWETVVRVLQLAGHKVSVVTMRYPSEETPASGKGMPIPASLRALVEDRIVFTCRLAKKPYCRKLRKNFHIWLDDNPEAIIRDAAEIWPQFAHAEGNVVDQNVNIRGSISNQEKAKPAALHKERNEK